MSKYNQIVNKIITAPSDVFIIFYSPSCIYSMMALNLLRKSNFKYKSYNIDKIRGNMSTVKSMLSQNYALINYNLGHNTKPVIFYNRKFLGGYSNLKEFVGSRI